MDDNLKANFHWSTKNYEGFLKKIMQLQKYQTSKISTKKNLQLMSKRYIPVYLLGALGHNLHLSSMWLIRDETPLTRAQSPYELRFHNQFNNQKGACKSHVTS